MRENPLRYLFESPQQLCPPRLSCEEMSRNLQILPRYERKSGTNPTLLLVAHVSLHFPLSCVRSSWRETSGFEFVALPSILHKVLGFLGCKTKRLQAHNLPGITWAAFKMPIRPHQHTTTKHSNHEIGTQIKYSQASCWNSENLNHFWFNEVSKIIHRWSK